MQEKVLSEADVCQIKAARLKRSDAPGERRESQGKGKHFSRMGQQKKTSDLIDTATQQKKRVASTWIKRAEKTKGAGAGRSRRQR